MAFSFHFENSKAHTFDKVNLILLENNLYIAVSITPIKVSKITK